MKAVSHLADSRAPAGRFDVARIREDFPILQQKVHGKPLVYFDNGATSQKPQAVMDEYRRLLNEKTKFVSVTHVSNALGTIAPVKEIVALAHERSIPVLLDGAQAVPHLRVDMQDLGCDFYAFSGHKMFGPTGVGVLYGRGELLEKMPPYQGGGDMISLVTFEKTHYNVLPYKFEAGTPHI